MTNLILTACVAIGWAGMVVLALARLNRPLARWELPLLFVFLAMQLGGLVALLATATVQRLAGGAVDFTGLYAALAWLVAFLACVPLLWKLGKNRETLRTRDALRETGTRGVAR